MYRLRAQVLMYGPPNSAAKLPPIKNYLLQLSWRKPCSCHRWVHRNGSRMPHLNRSGTSSVVERRTPWGTCDLCQPQACRQTHETQISLQSLSFILIIESIVNVPPWTYPLGVCRLFSFFACLQHVFILWDFIVLLCWQKQSNWTNFFYFFYQYCPNKQSLFIPQNCAKASEWVN